MQYKILFWVLTGMLLIQSCSPKFNVNEYLPAVDFRGVNIDKLEPEINIINQTIKAKLNLRLKFRFSNPYDIPLRVPDHDFKFKMNGTQISELSKNKASFVIPPNSSIIQSYTLELNLDPQGYFKNFMGKDNAYTFESTFHIVIKEYVKNKYACSALKYIFKSEKIEVPFEFGDTLRLALPPKIRPVENEFASIEFLGNSNQINLSPLSPFVEFLLEHRIPVYAPTWTNPFRTRDVNPADLIVEKLAIVDPQASQKWTNFKNKWDEVKGNLKIEFPGPNTSGFKISIPINIVNPNEFPIEASFFNVNARYNESYSPYIVEFKAANGSKSIPGRTTRKYYLSWQTNFFNGNILDMFGNGQLLPNTPGINGKMGIDFGYGIMEIPLNINVPLKFGG